MGKGSNLFWDALLFEPNLPVFQAAGLCPMGTAKTGSFGVGFLQATLSGLI